MLEYFNELWNDFVNFMWQLLMSFFDMFKDLWFWIFEQALALALLAVDGMGSLFNGLDVAQYIGMLPPETSFILSQIGLSQAMGMILTSITIRIVLQTIPFVRWGS